VLGFLSPQAKDHPDPLSSAKLTAAWLRQLPSLDVIGRQEHVLRAFDGMRRSHKPIDLNRVAAIEYLDVTLGPDRRQLIKQYVENAESSAKLADRLWQVAQQLGQGFAAAYQACLDEATAEPGNARWAPVLPTILARLIHYYGTDAKLRVFRLERWIPAKWMELHKFYVLAAEVGVERDPVALTGAGANATRWTVEQEYIYVLLLHQLNTGNLSPPELDWASAQLRAWCRKLTLESVPASPDGFVVDLAGKAGLVRRNGDAGQMPRYLDTAPLADQLEAAVFALRQAEATDQGPSAPINQQRIAILEKIRPAMSPSPKGDLRRDPRVAVSVAAKVRVGLPRICRDLGARDVEPANDPHAQAEQIEVYAVANGPRSRRQPVVDENDSLAASISMHSDQMWQVKDRSIAGLRIAASGGIGQSLALGALVAVRQSDVTDWVVGVVRRLNKLSNDEVEAGISLIAERVVTVALHTKREAKEEFGMVVNGVDQSTMGARFEGLYLPPPSRPDKPLSVKSLIVPTPEYADGRHLILTTGRSIYTIALRQLVEQRAEWSWAAFQVVEKKPKLD
jgi:hypothetical protein